MGPLGGEFGSVVMMMARALKQSEGCAKISRRWTEKVCEAELRKRKRADLPIRRWIRRRLRRRRLKRRLVYV